VFGLRGLGAARALAYGQGGARGALAAVVSAVVARLSLTLAARDGVPPARPEGRGAAVAGVVPLPGAVGTALLVTGLAAAGGSFLG
ncbi:adenosylcobinamide-GDP ribazoletransferase, partial [Streptomyces pilosus]